MRCGEKIYVGHVVTVKTLRLCWGHGVLMGIQGISTDFCWGYSLEVQGGGRKVTVWSKQHWK